MISEIQQQRLIYAWVNQLNESSGYPVVYAGHKTTDGGMVITLFSLVPVKGKARYGDVVLLWHEIEREIERYGFDGAGEFE